MQFILGAYLFAKNFSSSASLGSECEPVGGKPFIAKVAKCDM